MLCFPNLSQHENWVKGTPNLHQLNPIEPQHGKLFTNYMFLLWLLIQWFTNVVDYQYKTWQKNQHQHTHFYDWLTITSLDKSPLNTE